MDMSYADWLDLCQMTSGIVTSEIGINTAVDINTAVRPSSEIEKEK